MSRRRRYAFVQSIAAALCGRRKRRRATSFAGLRGISVAILVGFSSPSFAIDAPDEATFTAQAAAAFRSQLDAAEVKIIGPLALDIKVPHGVHRAYLNNVYRMCRLNADQCDTILAGHVGEMATYYLHASDPTTVESLRIGIRSRSYVDRLQVQARNGGLLARPFVGDLLTVVLIDQPTVMKLAQANDIEPLHLDATQAFDIGLRNTRADLAKSVADLKAAARRHDQVSGFAGNAYVASLMAYGDLWPDIAAAMGGHVIATAPGSDLLLIAKDEGEASVGELYSMGQEAQQRTQHPLPGTVYRWQEGGWKIVRF